MKKESSPKKTDVNKYRKKTAAILLKFFPHKKEEIEEKLKKKYPRSTTQSAMEGIIQQALDVKLPE